VGVSSNDTYSVNACISLIREMRLPCSYEDHLCSRRENTLLPSMIYAWHWNQNRDMWSACTLEVGGYAVTSENYLLKLHVDTGMAYSKLGQQERAIADLSEVLKLNPDHVNAAFARCTRYFCVYSVFRGNLTSTVQSRPLQCNWSVQQGH
jgi:tetratricopeptide (TPR) repeat protein